MMSEAVISHVNQDSQQFTENLQASEGIGSHMVTGNQVEDEEMEEDHEMRIQKALNEQGKL